MVLGRFAAPKKGGCRLEGRHPKSQSASPRRRCHEALSRVGLIVEGSFGRFPMSSFEHPRGRVASPVLVHIACRAMAAFSYGEISDRLRGRTIGRGGPKELDDSWLPIQFRDHEVQAPTLCDMIFANHKEIRFDIEGALNADDV